MDFILCRTRCFGREMTVNGDKSLTHRGLILGSLARGRTILTGYSRGFDCLSTMKVLRGLGMEIQETDCALIVKGRGFFGFDKPAAALDCGNSGTTMRLMAGLLSAQSFSSLLTGDQSLCSRPMDRVITPLKLMGADIEPRTGGRYAPLKITGARLYGITYTIPVASAQVKSALLLAGLHARGETVITEPVLTRDHTERMLEYFGADIQRLTPGRTRVTGGAELTGQQLDIPGDISSAGFFAVLAGIIGQNPVRIKKVGINPGRTGILDVLRQMNVKITVQAETFCGQEPAADLVIEPGPLRAVEIGGALIPRLIDEIPILAVAATQACGTTIIRDAAELRIKETDRIDAIVTGLARMKAKICATPDGMIIEGPVRLQAAEVESRHDHRIAMALSIAGLIAEGDTVVRDADCVAISLPEFADIVHGLCGADSLKIQNTR